MKRSLPAVLALFATVCAPSLAHADLDSLLGDWAAAATQDASEVSDSDPSRLPADEPLAEIDSDFSDNLQTTTRSRTDNPRPAAKPLPPTEKTLASHNAQASHNGYGQHDSYAEQGGTVMAQPPMDFYAPAAPTINPYYVPTTGNCNGNCQTGSCGCSGGCGQLIATNRPCHHEGESECRPHRRPLLPPPSTILQMFRSKNSYSTVWAGYAEETRTRLRNTSPDLNGTWNSCDNAGLIEPGCNACGKGCGKGCSH